MKKLMIFAMTVCRQTKVEQSLNLARDTFGL
jgi:hypothetical protein